MRLRLGLLVLLTAGLLAGMILMFGSLPGLFKRTTTYTVRFTDAPGLAPGAPVRRSGVKIGTVQDIRLDEDQGIVRVKIGIDQPYAIRKSEQATLVAGLLGSDVGIDLLPRDPEEKEPIDRTPYEVGAELLGVRAASVNTLLKGASDVVPTTQQTLNEIRKSIQRLEKLADRAEKTIPIAEETLRVYRDMGNDARKLVPEFQKTNAQFQRVGKQAEDALSEMRRTNDEVGGLTREVRGVIPELSKTNRQIADAARSFQELTPTIETTLDEYRGLSADLRKTLPVVRANIEDAGAAARNIGRLAERADVMLQTNQDKIEKSLDNLNKTLERAALLISDDNVRNVNNILSNTSKASNKLPSISNNADELTRQGLATLRQLDQTLRKVDAAVTDAQRVLQPLGARGERMAKNADESLQKANAVLTDIQSRSGGFFKGFDDTSAKANLVLDDIRALLKAIDRADGTFRKFLTDPSLYNNVDAAVVGVLKLMPRVDRVLKDVETFADKLARHPELIGVGGAVRPSDGLKNPPTPPLPPTPGHGHPVQVFTPRK